MMKTAPFLLILLLLFSGCDKEDAPACLQAAGEMTSIEVEVAPFDELIVYGRIKLFIEQGTEHKVIIQDGANLIENITATVENGRLSLRNNNNCNFFRDYNTTTVFVTVPNLSWLQNAGNNTIESVGALHFPKIWLRSFNQEKDKEIYTNGDFKLDLVSDYLRITGDNYSNFFLTGSTNYFNLYIADGDGRVESAGLISEVVEIQHRGTNKLFVNPQQELKGEIRSTGDVISVNRPPVVNLPAYYTGKLIFQVP